MTDDAAPDRESFDELRDLQQADRRQLEEAQRETLLRLALALQHAKAGTWDWDVATGTITWSPELFGLFGLDARAVSASFEAWRNALHPDDAADAESRIGQALAERNRLDSDYRVVLPGGDIRWINSVGQGLYDASGQPTRMIGLCLDITARKHAEEALQRTERSYHHQFAQNTSVMLLIDPNDGTILDANAAAERFYGFTRDQLLSRHITDINVQQATVTREAMESVPADGGVGFKFRHRLADGSVRSVEVSSSRVLFGSRAVLHSIIHDVTDRERADQENAILQAQLQQARKMESIGRLAGGVAHDFNNMLGAILGNVELALDQVGSTGTLREDLEEIKVAALRSADLTRQLLAFARKQTVSLKVLDLNRAVAGILAMLRRLIGENVQLAWLPGDELWTIRMDPSQLDQILTNLCINARDAISSVGKLTVETSNVRLDEDYRALHAESVPGDYVRLTVSDDGCGMDEETQAHLFEPFFTTKGMGKGTGLGLATVYGIVMQNHGSIEVQSEPGHGTTFKICLPRHQATPLPTRRDESGAPAVDARGTILLVEDEATVLRLAKRLLEQIGYVVLAAATPSEALRIAEEHAGEVSLLVTDVVMPEMNGRDLAKKLLSLYPTLKRLFMSGYTADVIADQGVLDDDVNFLQKPFSREALSAAVRRALDDG
jgi:PAS domain S-box-containing protein